MKKVILLIMSALLVVAFAVPAMADVSFGGGLTGSFITGFAPKTGESIATTYSAYADLTADVDEYNTAVFDFNIATWPGATSGAPGWYTVAAFLETDVGAALGLPLGLTTKAGKFVAATRAFEATAHGYERVGQMVGVLDGLQAALDFGMGTVTVGTSIGNDFTGAAAWPAFVGGAVAGASNPLQYVILALPEIGPVDFEAAMYAAGQTEFKPAIAANVKVGFEPVDIAAGFAFDLAKGSNLQSGSEWDYGVGAKASFGMFAAGVGLNGNDANILNALSIEAGAEVMEDIGVDVGVGLSMAKNADLFQGAEISAYYSPGASTWRVGYIITTNFYGYKSLNIANLGSTQDGGLFVTYDVAF